MKLHQLHVRQWCARFKRQRHAIASVFAPPRRRTPINMNVSARCQHHRRRLDNHLATIRQTEAIDTVNTPIGLEQFADVHALQNRNLATINLVHQRLDDF